MKNVIVSLTIALILFSVGATAAQTQASVTNGARNIKNGKDPENDSQTLELEELWRVGDEDEDVFFGLISDVDVGEDGNLYVLDAQLDEVKVLSPGGEYLRTIGRSGDGPGEFRGSFTLALLSDGSFGVAQSYPGKLVGLRPNGDPRKDIVIKVEKGGAFAALNSVCQGGGNLVVCATNLDFSSDMKKVNFNSFIRTLKDDGGFGPSYYETSVLFEPGKKFNETDYAKVERPFTLTHEGGVILAPEADQYLFEVYDSSGDLQLSVSRENENWERTDRARYFILTDMRIAGKGLGLFDIQLNKEEQEILQLHRRSDGSVWVMTGKNAYWHNQGEFRFDVFTEAGDYDHRARVFVDGDPNLDKMIFLGEDRILLLRGYKDSFYKMGEMKRPWTDSEPIVPVELVCYRIKNSH